VNGEGKVHKDEKWGLHANINYAVNKMVAMVAGVERGETLNPCPHKVAPWLMWPYMLP
jgi:hypothetical protein